MIAWQARGMGLGLKLFVGALLGTGAAVTAAVLLGGDGNNSATAGVVWSGLYDQQRRFTVRRNGAPWAWSIDGGGSGTEPGAIDALKTVLGALGEASGDPFGTVSLDAKQGDKVLVQGRVGPGIGGGIDGIFYWSADVPSLGRVAEGYAPTRGAALLELLTWLDDHGGGVAVEVDPDAVTQPIPPDELPPQDPPPKPQPEKPKAPNPPKPPGQQPPDAGGWSPVNVVELVDAEGFGRWRVAETIDPDGDKGPNASVVLVGYDRRWVGYNAALGAINDLATSNPGVTFVHFDFELSRQVFGQPESTFGYVATAIGPDGRARAAVMVGQKLSSLPLQSNRWAELVRFAEDGPGPNDVLLFGRRGPDNRRYVVQVRRMGGAWEWMVWRDQSGSDEEAAARGGSPSQALGRKAATSWIDARPEAGAPNFAVGA